MRSENHPIMATKNCRLLLNSINFENRTLSSRNKSFNSTEWLKRREKDIYLEKTKRENYRLRFLAHNFRCRSAFKLIEIDDKHKLVKPGYKVLDVGASPGSWSQVLAARTNSNGSDPDKPKGLVIATDLSFIYPINGVVVLSNLNFTEPSSQAKILEILNNEKLDFVFSDMAPFSSGVKSMDQENILNLVYPVLIFAVQNLNLGGGCLIKIWEGQHLKFIEQMKSFFTKFNIVKPDATYSSSSESYLLGRDFIGYKK